MARDVPTSTRRADPPRCAEALDLRADRIACARCGHSYPRLGEIPVLLPTRDAYLAACRAQLIRLDSAPPRPCWASRGRPARGTTPGHTRALRSDDPCARRPARGRAGDPGSLRPQGISRARPRARPATVEYLHNLDRDWAAPRGGRRKRARARVARGADRGDAARAHAGAGSGRVSSRVRPAPPARGRRDRGDRRTLLFTAAHTVVRGGTVSARSQPRSRGEPSQSAREWKLSAPGGPIDAERFHFLVADGLEPPFAAGSFDTVVTPWFIDQAPDDVRDFVGTVHRLLLPQGRWLNLGPLLYEPAVPIGLRFGREEIFDLAARAGFHVERCTARCPTSSPSSTDAARSSGCSGFAATRLDTPAPHADGPPGWSSSTCTSRCRPFPGRPWPAPRSTATSS